MRTFTRSISRDRRRSQAGFSLVEVLVSVAIMTVIMGATMGALSQAMKINQTAQSVTGLNNSLRTGMDLIIRDMLQVGSGLPTGHYILIPVGDGYQINLPGPPGTAYKSVVGDVDINAVNPGTKLGPLVNQIASTACVTESATCVKTDMLTTLAADSTFNDIGLTARAADGSSIDVDAAVNIRTGPDKVAPGQLMMLEKGSYAILLQVTSIHATANRIFFATGDSLNLNRPTTAEGSMGKPCTAGTAPTGGCGVAPLPTGLTAAAPSPDIALPSPQTTPATNFLNTTATRVRMISYYIDATSDVAHPRLVRRINNGDAVTFDNASGSAVAFDIDNMQISYDIANSTNNPANVKFVAADYTTSGACATVPAPAVCSVNQIRKVNITLSARSREVDSVTKKFYHNTLSTQVSLRGMSFVNEYTAP